MNAVTIATAFFGGGVAASISHALVVPIDVVKTRKQLPEYKGMTTMEVTTKTLAEPLALFDGLAATFWGYYAHGSIKFGLYYICKVQSAPLAAYGVPTVFLYLASGVAAECVASTVLCAFEGIRINQVSRRGGSFCGVGQELWNEGRLFNGISPLLFKMTIYTATQFTGYEMTLNALTGGATSTFVQRLIAGLCAGVLASLASQPGDTVLSIMAQERGEGADAKRGPVTVLKDIGFKQSFNGWEARLCLVAGIITTQMLVYDAIVTSIANVVSG